MIEDSLQVALVFGSLQHNLEATILFSINASRPSNFCIEPRRLLRPCRSCVQLAACRLRRFARRRRRPKLQVLSHKPRLKAGRHALKQKVRRWSQLLAFPCDTGSFAIVCLNSCMSCGTWPSLFDANAWRFVSTRTCDVSRVAALSSFRAAAGTGRHENCK